MKGKTIRRHFQTDRRWRLQRLRHYAFNNEQEGSMTHRNVGVNTTKSRKLSSGIIFSLMKMNGMGFQLSSRQLYSLRDERSGHGSANSGLTNGW